jgi:integrase
MSKTILTSERLNTILLQFIDNLYKIDFYYADIAQNLYNTGLRFHELLEPERITIIDEDNIEFLLQKGSGTRIIPSTQLTDYLLANILTHNDPYYFCNLSTFKNMFSYYSPVPVIKHKNKSIKSHLFRHNFVKQLSLQGYNVSEISEIISEKNETNTLNYINSALYYNS